ncbi:GH92 family glycosyl hydrolase [Luteolibacter pohnpeiensis]|uniref:GH92 family glycosyl hydrolase n=1 Tax=Luteolibacter pohnpeiensis TaxID=454153 RepID=UPI003CCD4F69
MTGPLLAFLFCIPALAAEKQPAEYVNTLQGTNSKYELTRGNTYPTTALPFGMNTWTPQTGENGNGWKYQYEKDTIRGFQQAHQCSSWTNDYAVFSLMPVTGPLVVGENDRQAKFSHDHEEAHPYHYQVDLENGIRAEIAPTERGAYLRFRFPKDSPAHVILDGYTKFSAVKILPEEHKIIGRVNNGRGLRDDVFSNFVIVFDQPFSSWGTWENQNNTIQKDQLEADGKGVGAFVTFEPGVVVQAKVASSYVDSEQAERTLKQELGAFQSVDEASAAAKKIWNDHLSRIKMEGGSEDDLATFYSCFFRASLFSRKFYEINAEGKAYYRSPYDGKLHDGKMFTDTGFWDTFRAQFPLSIVMHPTMQGEYVHALLDAYDQCGWLPSWSFPSERGGMIGNHAISLLADAWAKGIHTFDPKKALEAYHHEATQKGPWGPSNGRDGGKYYDSLGYVPYPEVREATAKTLEYAYDDFCGYHLAEMSGQIEQAEFFAKSMYNFKNVFDPETEFMRGRDADGKWNDNFDPTEWGGPFTEGCAWHWVWSVFHDVDGLIELLGGDEKFVQKLDGVFTATNEFKVGTYGGPIHEMTEMKMANMGQYAHGNQPIQHMTYLYDYAGQPWKTQQHVREVMAKLYNATENGYPGDEDQGQTSSWYVLSALGFYAVCPGTDQYVIGSPAFEKATITLEDGKTFTVHAKNNSPQNVYIQSAKLNGETWTKNFIRYADLMKGGVLELEMGPTPNKQRGVAKSDRPFSLSASKE